MLILTDLDDTVLNFGDRFERWSAARGLPMTGRLRDIYRVERLLGVDVGTAIDLIREFTADRQVRHEAEPCALEVLPRLRARGWRFVGISACGEDPGYRRRRLDNLLEAFGFPFEDLICVPLGGCKAEILSRFPASVWVEDNATHAATGAGAGHRTFLVDRPYNVGAALPPEVVRVRGWHDVETALADVSVHP